MVLGPEGLNRMIKDWEDKSATAVCMMAYTESQGQPIHLFEGRTEGKIVEPKGRLDFGWDPCFLPDNHSQTYGEMDEALKNTISHRYKCTVQFKNFLEQSLLTQSGMVNNDAAI